MTKMDSFEERLILFGSEPVNRPDSEKFLLRLHEELRRRDKVRQRILTTAVAAVVAVATTLGLFQNLWKEADTEYWMGDEFQFFSGLGEEETYLDTSYVDDSFVLEVMDYLLQEADFAATGWDLLEDMDALGIINISESTL